MQKVLGIFCHPDDEILFGWPIFQATDIEKYLIICCSDFSRKGVRRELALKEICKNENINLFVCLDEDNNFYALPTRKADYILTEAINVIETQIEKAIIEIKPDYIFTHNPVGEYGHGSHRLIFELVSQNELVKNLLITDICQESNHRSHKEIPKFIQQIYYSNIFRKNCNFNIDFYNRCKATYDKYYAWTYSEEPITECSLYLLKENV